MAGSIRQRGKTSWEVRAFAGKDLEERRRRRRAGDPRLNEQDRAILRRVTRGDLAEEFQAALDADLLPPVVDLVLPILAEGVPTVSGSAKPR